MRRFLTAKWQDLIMANYKIEPSFLTEFVPRETELDFYDCKCCASLVAFKFLNTKILGLSVPFHTNFEEVNLRTVLPANGSEISVYKGAKIN